MKSGPLNGYSSGRPRVCAAMCSDCQWLMLSRRDRNWRLPARAALRCCCQASLAVICSTAGSAPPGSTPARSLAVEVRGSCCAAAGSAPASVASPSSTAPAAARGQCQQGTRAGRGAPAGDRRGACFNAGGGTAGNDAGMGFSVAGAGAKEPAQCDFATGRRQPGCTLKRLAAQFAPARRDGRRARR